jgi:hypothetical protein
MSRELLKSLPVEVLQQLPKGIGNDPAALREALNKLPVETLRSINSKKETLTPDQQVEGSVRSFLSDATGGLSEYVAAGLDALSIPQTREARDKAAKEGVAETMGRQYRESIDRGKDLKEKIPDGNEGLETLIRSGLEVPSFGISEPLISGTKAAFKTLFSGGGLADNFRADRAQREASQEKLPFIDMPAQVGGMFAAPTGIIRRLVGGAMAAKAPQIAEKVVENAPVVAEAAVAAKNGASVLSRAGREVGAIAKEGLKAGVDVAEQAAGRNLFLKSAGFVGEDEAGVADSAEDAAMIGGGIRSVGTGFKAIGKAGKYILPVFLSGGSKSFGSKDISYYLANFDRLKGVSKDPKLAEVVEDIGGAVQRIRDDFNAAVIDEKSAKEAVKALEEQIKVNRWDQKAEVKELLKEAQSKLAVDFAENKAQTRAFSRALPREAVGDVEQAVLSARQAVVEAHKKKMEILAASKSPINIEGLTGTIDEAAAALNVGAGGKKWRVYAEGQDHQRRLVGTFSSKDEAKAFIAKEDEILQEAYEAGKPGPGAFREGDVTSIASVTDKKGVGAFGKEAQAAQSRLVGYKKTLEKLQKKYGKEIPPDEAYKLVNQIDKDTEYFTSLTGFKDTADATMSRVRGDLQSRIVKRVEGYGDALEANREAGRFLDEVSQYFDSKERIYSTLGNITSPEKRLAADVLVRLGERTGKDFGKVLQAAAAAAEEAASPRAQAEMKAALAVEHGIPDLMSRLDEFQNPHQQARILRQQVEASPEYAALVAAQNERNQLQQMDDLFRGFTDMTIENKVKAVMDGKQSVRKYMQALGTLSDKDFVQALDDLGVLARFDKTAINGSRRVNLFAVLGYAAASNANPAKKANIAALSTTAAAFLDTYGPRMTRGILDAVGNIRGLVTADKIAKLPLPEAVKRDLISQFARAMYFGTDASFEPNVTVTPETAMMLKQEVRNSDGMSKADKAQAITEINRKGTFSGVNKLLMGGRPVPKEAPAPQPIEQSISLEELSKRLQGAQ